MGKFDGSKKQEEFTDALQGKNIPVLTLDNKWYRLLNQLGRDDVKPLEEELNALLKRQGKMNTETKDIKKLKKKLMNDIVSMVDEVDETGNKSLEKKIEENKRLLEDCNKKLEEYSDEMLEVPREIERVNNLLMIKTMQNCYETMQENTDEIQEISEWVTQVRIDLKKRLIHKQEMETKNHEIYSYMHDIFGADVVNMFDLRYNPDEHFPKSAQQIKKDDKPDDVSHTDTEQ
jgi:vacuolar-type H+-ATPase subunit H